MYSYIFRYIVTFPRFVWSLWLVGLQFWLNLYILYETILRRFPLFMLLNFGRFCIHLLFSEHKASWSNTSECHYFCTDDLVLSGRFHRHTQSQGNEDQRCEFLRAAANDRSHFCALLVRQLTTATVHMPVTRRSLNVYTKTRLHTYTFGSCTTDAFMLLLLSMSRFPSEDGNHLA